MTWVDPPLTVLQSGHERVGWFLISRMAMSEFSNSIRVLHKFSSKISRCYKRLPVRESLNAVWGNEGGGCLLSFLWVVVRWFIKSSGLIVLQVGGLQFKPSPCSPFVEGICLNITSEDRTEEFCGPCSLLRCTTWLEWFWLVMLTVILGGLSASANNACKSDETFFLTVP